MAGVRRAGPRRLETVVLRDLRCVQTIRWTHLYACPSPPTCTHTPTDGDRLLCNETLDDLNNVWQSPPDPQGERQSSSQAGQGMKSSGSCSTCSPETHRPVPPNSPADAVGRAGAQCSANAPNSPADAVGRADAQCSANAYITYLARSWRAGEAQSSRGTALTSAARHLPAADGALPPARSTSRPAGQKHVLLLGPDSSVDHLAAFVSAHDVEGEDDVAMRGRDDILVIPDDTAEQLTSVPRVRPGEQCVPADDVQPGSVDADDDSLFVEDAWLAPTHQAPNLCHSDHVVPRRVPWEE